MNYKVNKCIKNSDIIKKLTSKKPKRQKAVKPFIGINTDKQIIGYKVLPDSLLHTFTESNKIIDYKEFKLIRIESLIYKNCFKILVQWYNDSFIQFGELYYTRRVDKNLLTHAWIKIENRCLYTKFNIYSNISIFADYICDVLGIEINNVKDLDICFDCSKNVCRKIISLIRNNTIDTILNARVIKDRKSFLMKLYIIRRVHWIEYFIPT
ncbi:MAG: hypothetical protein LUH15_16585 [Tannerellaceae bacterium]|nr:hypothetical protein [Tannerellaceae bacterium]